MGTLLLRTYFSFSGAAMHVHAAFVILLVAGLFLALATASENYVAGSLGVELGMRMDKDSGRMELVKEDFYLKTISNQLFILKLARKIMRFESKFGSPHVFIQM